MKNLKKVLVLLLVASMCAGTMNLPVFADSTNSKVVDNGDGTQTEITTSVTEETDEDGKTTVTIKVDKNTEGTTTEGNVKVNRTESTTTTTVTDKDGATSEKKVTEGYERKEWTEEDDGNTPGQPAVEVELLPGKETSASVSTQETSGNVNGSNGQTVTTIVDRTVTAKMSDVTTEITTIEGDMTGVTPELKFDRNNATDQAEQKKIRELYTDNGHFHDPETFDVTDAPEGYPYKYVGHGDYSGHYVSHIRVIYERDEAGNALKDENGNYIIKELQHVSSGTPLHYNGELSTNIQGPFHYGTGTRPTQFLLMNEDGDTVYAYCIDVETGAESGSWYGVANLEDNDYYASEEAENHIRNIVMNGYWGTKEGVGSLASLKEALKAAVAGGVVDEAYDVNFVNRKKFTEGYELQEGEYHYGTYVYWNLPTEHVELTDEIIDGLTEGEALDAMQMAIWSFANGAVCALDGEDGVVIGDPYTASSQVSDSLNGKNDWAGAARTKALYEYLIGLNAPMESTIVINDKNNVKDVSLTVGDKVADHADNLDDDKTNDVYNAEMNFTLAFTPDPVSDDLLVHITYIQDGEEVTVVRRLAGEDSEGRTHETIYPDDDGVYTLSGLQLSENEDFQFDLRLEGMQYLKRGAYIYTAKGGIGASQTFVGLSEGTNTVDISKSMTISFDVDEDNHIVAEREWYFESDPIVTPPEEPEETEPEETEPEETEPEETEPEETEPEETKPEETEPAETEAPEIEPEDDTILIEDDDIPLTDIPDEPVPQTGDSAMWYLCSVFAAIGLFVLHLSDKKKKFNA